MNNHDSNLNTMKPGAHGGCMASFSQRFPQAPKPWLDLSTGLNPNPYPIPEFPADMWSHLPQSDAMAALKMAAAKAYGCAQDRIVVAPGTQAAIGVLPYLLGSDDVIIQSPTYSGHAESWMASGATCHVTDRIDPARMTGRRSYVLCRPNNPDGYVTPLNSLLRMADAALARQATLVLDASFADFSDDDTQPLLDNPAVIILRSFGKTYGLAGVRLGFALGCHPVLTRLAAAFGTWPVNNAALMIGTVALRDEAWRKVAQRHLMKQANRLRLLMMQRDFKVVGGTCLFTLFDHPEAPKWWTHLARHGIATRYFPSHPRRIRMGTPGDDAAFDRLTNAFVRAPDAATPTQA